MNARNSHGMVIFNERFPCVKSFVTGMLAENSSNKIKWVKVVD